MEEVNSVQVHSIDEERLKFRCIFSVAPSITGGDGRGAYRFSLPPLTSFGNSHVYDSCLINCDSFCAHTSLGTADPCWTVGPPFNFVKSQGSELRLDVPSSQSNTTHQLLPAFVDVGDISIGGFRQLVPFELKLIGDGTAGIVNPIAYGYEGEGKGEPLLCANPFGSSITITNNHPHTNSRQWLVSNAAGAVSPDLGLYVWQFTITMVPNSS